MHAGHIHFKTISSVPGCGGHLQICLQSCDIGVAPVVGMIHAGPGPKNGVPGFGIHPQVHSDDDTTDVVANAIQMPIITIKAVKKFILIISLKLNLKNWIN